ncbi:hypothetical protein IF2G_02961 [Cordyceps javanica]|nr:hypothetical protein IF2G_02961 [Cordyceps javanica]
MTDRAVLSQKRNSTLRFKTRLQQYGEKCDELAIPNFAGEKLLDRNEKGASWGERGSCTEYCCSNSSDHCCSIC